MRAATHSTSSIGAFTVVAPDCIRTGRGRRVVDVAPIRSPLDVSRLNFHFEDGAVIAVNHQVDGIVVVDQFREVRN